jgi:hypothetical protein
MGRSLKSGYPLNASLRVVAESMQDPISTEFGIAVDQISYGDELVVAMHKLADRVATEDFRFLAASISIQHGTGGNLGRVLGVLDTRHQFDGPLHRKPGSPPNIPQQILFILLYRKPFPISHGANRVSTHPKRPSLGGNTQPLGAHPNNRLVSIRPAGKQPLTGELPDAFQLFGTQFLKIKKKRRGRLGGLHGLQRGGFHKKQKRRQLIQKTKSSSEQKISFPCVKVFANIGC